MFLDTLCVNRKSKLTRPSAGLEIPSIFCSPHGPRSVFVVVVWTTLVAACQGQPNLMLGRCTLTPTTCSAADSAISARDAIALRKISPTAITAVHLAHGGMRRRRGGLAGPSGSGRARVARPGARTGPPVPARQAE